MLAFVLANATRITHSSFVLLVNQQQMIFRAAERPWAGWLAGAAGLRSVIGTVLSPRP